MDKKRVNIYVIANEANVSPVTVSRVINRYGRLYINIILSRTLWQKG